MRRAALTAVILLPLAPPSVAQAPPSGEAIFRTQCGACHGMDNRNRVGPGLAGSWERRAASVEGFRYSPALRARAEAGLAWDEANLRAYLRNPREFIPGGTMAYAGLRDEARLDALISYLRERGGG